MVLSIKRYEHSRRVMQTACALCPRFGITDEKERDEVFFAAIAHDLCKELSDPEILALSQKDGEVISEDEKQKPVLLHGRACAVKLAEDFAGDERVTADVLEAVREHTYGKKGMGKVAQIVYIADKIEPGRSRIDAAYQEKIKNMAPKELLLFVVSENIEFLEKEGKKPSPQSLELLQSLKQEKI